MIRLFLAILTLFFSACQNGPLEEKEKTSLHVCMKEEPCWMDPRRGVDMIASQLHFMLFEGLFRYNPDSSISPGLAKKCELSEDGKVYTFHLREALWSNHKPITAHDIEWSWKSLLSPNFPCRDAYLIYDIKNAEKAKKGEVEISQVGIYAKDDHTLIVELETPSSSFLEITALSFLAPVPAEVAKENPNWANELEKNCIISGPFRLSKWEHNNEMVFQKNPHYWRENEVRLDQITMHIIPNERSSLRMFTNGSFDIIGAPLSPLPASFYPEIESHLVKTAPIAGTKILSFNTQKYPLTNVHLRKALSMAVDRSAMVETVTHLKEKIAERAIPPVLCGEDISFLEDHDDEKATYELSLALEDMNLSLDELPPITISYWASSTNNLIAQQIQQKWKLILGIEAKLEKLDFKSLLSATKDGSYSVALLAYLAEFPDSLNIFERYKDKENARNYSNWEREEYKLLINKLKTANTTDANFYKGALEELLIEEAPFSPLYHYNYAFLVQPRVKNFSISPLGHIFFDLIYLEE